MSSKAEMEKEEIQNLIKQRSLYTLKKKFEKYKDQISQIYNENKKSSSNLPVISIDKTEEVISNIMNIAQFTAINSNNFNDLITSDLMTSESRKNSKKIIENISQYAKLKVTEYNKIFYEKKMK